MSRAGALLIKTLIKLSHFYFQYFSNIFSVLLINFSAVFLQGRGERQSKQLLYFLGEIGKTGKSKPFQWQG